MAVCTVVRPSAPYGAKHGLTYFEGISKESAGSGALCLHMVEIPPLARATPHLHQDHESAIYTLEGAVEMLYGEQLEQHIRVEPGDYLHIPAGVPHCPWNPSPDVVARAIIARTDANERESLVLREDLEPLVEQWLASRSQSV